MDVFYNSKGVGDVLLIPIKRGERYNVQSENFGPITKITNQENELLGYNIFEAKSHFPNIKDGKQALDTTWFEQLKQLFQANNLDDDLDIDVSPKFVVGYVTSKAAHENADKLSVCQVDVGEETLQIVCGAPNVDQGQKVVVAKVGAIMPSGLQIKPTELRGVPSNGMICSQKELAISNAPAEKGIYVLEDTYQVGNAFSV